ncbi:hypothetical protein DEU56DRAFT_757385 [Suillus clintonianus]|uniref:uncharacterized protein n=1 Tax=Suillus clintonianus TaxID=1904413 RepID=UPI001B86F0C5|nr:uncharacterized protein DEU56DRAFT_757385 [Suillus clintonianus]KAG2132030.1 hypothetical protein DEU56DRAFT_757385 [Suillus clintonianus]
MNHNGSQWTFPTENTYLQVPNVFEQLPIHDGNGHVLPNADFELPQPPSSNQYHGRHIQQADTHPMSCPSTPARQPHFYTDPTSGLRRSPRKMCPEGLSFIPSQNGTSQNHDHRWNNHSHTIFSLPSNFSDQGHILSSGDGENDIPEAPTMPMVTPAKTPVRRIRARAAPKTLGSATPVPKPKSMRGTGSKSGEGNRRTSGNSDDEISKLAESQLGRAGLKLEPEGLGAAPVETPAGYTVLFMHDITRIVVL